MTRRVHCCIDGKGAMKPAQTSLALAGASMHPWYSSATRGFRGAVPDGFPTSR